MKTNKTNTNKEHKAKMRKNQSLKWMLSEAAILDKEGMEELQFNTNYEKKYNNKKEWYV